MTTNLHAPTLAGQVSELEQAAAAAKAEAAKSAADLNMISVKGSVTMALGQNMIASFTPVADYDGGAPLADLRVVNATIATITASGKVRRWLVQPLAAGARDWLVVSDVGGSLSWTTA